MGPSTAFNAERLANFPETLFLLVLILCVAYLRRTHSKYTLDSWMIGIGLLFISQLSWYFTHYGTSSYAFTHTFRLVFDLLAGTAFLLYRPGRLYSRRMLDYYGWNVLALVVLQILYGINCDRPIAYVFCAISGCSAVLRHYSSRSTRRATICWLLLWIAIAIAAGFGNFRTAAYCGLFGIFAAAAIHLGRRRHQGFGRLVIVAGFSVLSISFLVHPWILLHPILRPAADNVWSTQRYFIAFGLLLSALEDRLRSNRRRVIADRITGLGKRRQMEVHLEATVTGGNAALLLLDINSFKKVNETYGRQAGNDVLRRVADLLRQFIEPDELLTRVDGDRFAITSPRSLTHLTPILRTLIAEPIYLDERRIEITVSIGTALFPKDLQSPRKEAGVVAQMIEVADRRLHEAQHRSKASILTRWPSLSQIN